MDPVVILGTDTLSAGPGEEARLPVRVRNHGRRVESYRVEVVGEPGRFCQVEPASVSVLPGREAEVTVTFRPPVGASTPTGTLPFGVRVTSEVRPTASAVAEGRLEVAGAAGLQAWADNTTMAGRWSARYRLSFANQGNAAVRLAVTPHDPAASLTFAVGDDVVDIPPGGTVSTVVRAKARRPFLRGSAVNRVFQVACQDFPFGAAPPVPGQGPPPDDPHGRSFQLSFQQKPVLSKGAMVGALLLIGILAAVVFFRLRGGDDVVLGMATPDQPQGVTAEAQGPSRVILSWDAVPNAAGYDIRTTTPDGQVSGPPLEHVDAVAEKFILEGLNPAETYCLAVEATGPEGVEKSLRSEHTCVTTEAPSQLAAPTELVVARIAGASFTLSWSYPGPIDGVTFSVFVDNSPIKENVAGLSTTIDVPRRELSYDTVIAVRAVSGDQASDFSNAEVVTVEALPAPTIVGDGSQDGTGGPGTQPDATVAPTETTPPPGETVAPTTATTAPPTTTTIAPLARGILQDLDATWAAVLGPITPPPAGVGEEPQRQRLAQDFGIAPEQIRTFSNRDTVVRLGDGSLHPLTSAPPERRFFYVTRLDEAAATDFCGGDQRCEPAILQGAAKAAQGTDILILDRLSPDARLDVVDRQIEALRDELDRFTIHVLDGAMRTQFSADEFVVFAGGFPSAQAITDFCAAKRINPCNVTRMEFGP